RLLRPRLALTPDQKQRKDQCVQLAPRLRHPTALHQRHAARQGAGLADRDGGDERGVQPRRHGAADAHAAEDGVEVQEGGGPVGGGYVLEREDGLGVGAAWECVARDRSVGLAAFEGEKAVREGLSC
ncbi:hypothetical protein SLS62_011452, partial [Diatrype stigma]